MGGEEEAEEELEAMVAVYGDDCQIISIFPPHINIRLRPRTADDPSKQFVEAVLSVRPGPLYPAELPVLVLVDSMGLDEERREELVLLLRNRGLELLSRPMLIALCEEAVDILTEMNHPEGNCPLCLDPLFQEDSEIYFVPFMKLMSCFHCFHSECIIRWWKWVQQEREKDARNPPQRIRSFFEDQQDVQISKNIPQANCPVCRKVFTFADLEHILAMVEANTNETCCSEATGESPGLDIINSEVEIRRREKFNDLLRIQQMNNGLIVPKKDLVVVPGMFLSEQFAPVPTGSEGRVGARTSAASSSTSSNSNASCSGLYSGQMTRGSNRIRSAEFDANCRDHYVRSLCTGSSNSNKTILPVKTTVRGGVTVSSNAVSTNNNRDACRNRISGGSHRNGCNERTVDECCNGHDKVVRSATGASRAGKLPVRRRSNKRHSGEKYCDPEKDIR